ncbi:MAG: flagellar basal-body rod protein FlgG [Thermoleophilaceae bacterium]|jgi:flagellar basal-body rod protein FlgG|nr:flagellar basal-body rod protein FlgG [Thermoleophilaceae bacterium]MEA2457044.1 flagellar basal-body rod protein FlgG [Thermoleophilaceae bacterium]
MIQGIGAALAGLTAGQQRMDALANDTANVDTTGFKVDPARPVQGALIETGQPLDLAIEGNGAFQLAGGLQTRDGSFQLDASAQIVSSSGASLAPPVQLPPGTDASSVRISPSGGVFVGGAQVGQVQTVGSGVIRQGTLESSNVDLADTAVGQIETRTSYAAAVKALHVQDEMWASLMELRR